MGIPGGLEAKDPPAETADTREAGSTAGKSPWGRTWHPLQYWCPEIPRTEEPGGHSPWVTEQVVT